MDARDEAARIIAAYDAQGWHRTATDVDRDSAEWLAREVIALGGEPRLEGFFVERVDPSAAFVEVAGRREAGLPLFDGTFTDSDGISGSLGLLGTKADIGLVRVTPGGAAAGLDDARRDGIHRAIVAVTDGGRPGLAPRNASSFRDPFGPPVLQVGSEALGWLREAAEAGGQATVVAAAERERTEAFNVAVSVPGTDSTLDPLVVMTPRSGWWYCAGERGGGLACWIRILQSVLAGPLEREVIFVATSGHELNHLGLESFMERRPAIALRAFAWVHLGASIGARHEPQPVFYSSDDRLERLSAEALQAAGAPAARFVPRRTRPPGESRNIHVAGGSYISLLGGNALFHLEADRFPDAVDLDAVTATADAFCAVTTKLARADATKYKDRMWV